MAKQTLTNQIKSNPAFPAIMGSLMNVSDFAKEKETSRQAIYQSIAAGKITPLLIGANKDIYIDSSQYQNLSFRSYGARRNEK